MVEFFDEYDGDVIRDNDSYFDTYTIDLLDENVNGLLRNTDNCTYVDKYRFKDRFGYDLPWSDDLNEKFNALYNGKHYTSTLEMMNDD